MKTVRLIPFLILAACAAPKKATIVEEPRKPDRVTAVTQEPVVPKDNEADQLRTPDLFEKLPDNTQFQATNPNLPRTRLNDGAAVIAKPPAETPR